MDSLVRPSEQHQARILDLSWAAASGIWATAALALVGLALVLVGLLLLLACGEALAGGEARRGAGARDAPEDTARGT